MSVRRGLPFILALLLGMSTAVLGACGGGGTKGGVPSASAGELKSEITDVGQAVDGDRCPEVEGQLRQVDEAIDQLPATTDNQLVSALRDGADRLRRVAVEECEDAGTETTTTETTPTETGTTPTDPETETVPTETAPTETTQTPTTTTPPPPPPTTTPTPPAPEPPVNPTPPVPPPVTPGGGVTPEIGPDD